MSSISPKKIHVVKKLYKKGLSVREIALELDVSVDAVTYFMRYHNLPRRTVHESNKLAFNKKTPTFSVKTSSSRVRELRAMGAMLYWGEGFKGNENSKITTVDFANSDPSMILMFLEFVRSVYKVEEKKFRVLLYCYADQDINFLIHYWTGITAIPSSQFSKPYVRKDFRKDGRKMKYGLIHVRYNDKKFLLEIKNLIDSYKRKYIAPVV